MYLHHVTQSLELARNNQLFGTAVRTKFLHIYDEIVEVKTPDFDPASRSSDSLRFRFKKAIAPDVRKFNKDYKRIKEKRPSGTTVSMYIEMASDEYVYTLGKAFRFGRCVEVLHQLPKFNVDLAIHHLPEDTEVVEIDVFDDTDVASSSLMDE